MIFCRSWPCMRTGTAASQPRLCQYLREQTERKTQRMRTPGVNSPALQFLLLLFHALLYIDCILRTCAEQLRNQPAGQGENANNCIISCSAVLLKTESGLFSERLNSQCLRAIRSPSAGRCGACGASDAVKTRRKNSGNIRFSNFISSCICYRNGNDTYCETRP